jgi:hypothetical protein
VLRDQRRGWRWDSPRDRLPRRPNMPASAAPGCAAAAVCAPAAAGMPAVHETGCTSGPCSTAPSPAEISFVAKQPILRGHKASVQIHSKERPFGEKMLLSAQAVAHTWRQQPAALAGLRAPGAAVAALGVAPAAGLLPSAPAARMMKVADQAPSEGCRAVCPSAPGLPAV